MGSEHAWQLVASTAMGLPPSPGKPSPFLGLCRKPNPPCGVCERLCVEAVLDHKQNGPVFWRLLAEAKWVSTPMGLAADHIPARLLDDDQVWDDSVSPSYPPSAFPAAASPPHLGEGPVRWWKYRSRSVYRVNPSRITCPIPIVIRPRSPCASYLPQAFNG